MVTIEHHINDALVDAYEHGMRDERIRCAAICDGLALACAMVGQGQSAVIRDNIRTAALWLRDEIRKGRVDYAESEMSS